MPHADGSLIIISVDDNSPASKAGIRIGDCITHVGGRPATEIGDLRDVVRNATEPLSVQVRKAGTDELQDITIQLAGQPLPGGCTTGLDAADPGRSQLSLWAASPKQPGLAFSPATEF